MLQREEKYTRSACGYYRLTACSLQRQLLPSLIPISSLTLSCSIIIYFVDAKKTPLSNISCNVHHLLKSNNTLKLCTIFVSLNMQLIEKEKKLFKYRMKNNFRRSQRNLNYKKQKKV